MSVEIKTLQRRAIAQIMDMSRDYMDRCESRSKLMADLDREDRPQHRLRSVSASRDRDRGDLDMLFHGQDMIGNIKEMETLLELLGRFEMKDHVDLTAVERIDELEETARILEVRIATRETYETPVRYDEQIQNLEEKIQVLERCGRGRSTRV